MSQEIAASLRKHLLLWWRRQRMRAGFFRVAAALTALLWEFAIESMPHRRRRRYGDAGYDWDFRVNTTSGTISWRERFLGLLHSPYQPTEPAAFHTMLQQFLQDAEIEPGEFVFVDIGSGKGRALLLASDYPFRRILGIELLPRLHQEANKNIAAYKSSEQKCFAMQSICADAAEFAFPVEPLVLYLFNPLPEERLAVMLHNLHISLSRQPRACYLLYHHPLHREQLSGQSWLEEAGGTQQFAIYRFRQQATVPGKIARME
jgi:hypothetical protein